VITPNPGSREYTLHCVADQAGVFLPVGQDNVHLSNAIAGSRPTWQFGVITNAVDNLQNLQPMNGATRTVRSILSWNLKPTGCDYKPIWGNVIEYRVRTDQCAGRTRNLERDAAAATGAASPLPPARSYTGRSRGVSTPLFC
jgi:hypothetical protein